MFEIEKIQQELKNNLSQRRYEHSIKVAKCARRLARHYGINEEKAYVAGLVHDIAKEFSSLENEKWIQKYNLSKDLLNPKYSKIIHADIGAVVVKQLYGLDDEICEAIRFHTIGNRSMNLLDKIIFISDKIARDKVDLVVKKAKDIVYDDIDKAMLILLNAQKEHLNKIGQDIHPDTLELINFLEDKNM